MCLIFKFLILLINSKRVNNYIKFSQNIFKNRTFIIVKFIMKCLQLNNTRDIKS